jgi:hypothetical protein
MHGKISVEKGQEKEFALPPSQTLWHFSCHEVEVFKVVYFVDFFYFDSYDFDTLTLLLGFLVPLRFSSVSYWN